VAPSVALMDTHRSQARRRNAAPAQGLSTEPGTNITVANNVRPTKITGPMAKFYQSVQRCLQQVLDRNISMQDDADAAGRRTDHFHLELPLEEVPCACATTLGSGRV